MNRLIILHKYKLLRAKFVDLFIIRSILLKKKRNLLLCTLIEPMQLAERQRKTVIYFLKRTP